MKNFIDELDEKAILTKNDVIKLKKYINEKYSDNSDQYKSKVLAKSIHRILDDNLDELGYEHRKDIRVNVIKNTFLNDEDKITKGHILNAMIPMLDKESSIKKQVIQWINNNQSTYVDKDIFDKYFIDRLSDDTDKIEEKQELNTKLIKDIDCNEIKIETDYAKKTYVLNHLKLWVKSTIKIFIDLKANLQKNIKRKITGIQFTSKIFVYISIFILMISLFTTLLIIDIKKNSKIKNAQEIEKKYIPKRNGYEEDYEDVVSSEMRNHIHLLEEFNYKNINKDKLLMFLRSKNSLLAEDPYFSEIIYVSKQFNLNPLVLFAIAGQEQGFVPKDNVDAYEIANNPFNVFHSWQEYNTNIYDSSRIVAITVINLSKDKPENMEVFEWINKKYAEDKNWSKGISLIYEELVKATE